MCAQRARLAPATGKCKKCKQGGELFDVRNEEINQTRVRVKVHVSELFLHRNAALHAAERDAARSLVFSTCSWH